MVVEGIPFFVSPKKMKEHAKKILEMPEDLMHKLGLFIMLAGLFVVYIGSK